MIAIKLVNGKIESCWDGVPESSCDVSAQMGWKYSSHCGCTSMTSYDLKNELALLVWHIRS